MVAEWLTQPGAEYQLELINKYNIDKIALHDTTHYQQCLYTISHVIPLTLEQ